MKKEKICVSNLCKNIAYILIPILLLILVTSIISVIYIRENTDINSKTDKEFFDTKVFSSSYMYSINKALAIIMSNNLPDEQEYDYIEGNYYNYDIQKNVDINRKQGNIFYWQKSRQENFIFLIIDNNKNIAVSDDVLKIFQKQLETKDKQIERLQNTVDYFQKENLALNQQIELLLNDDVQDIQIEEIDDDLSLYSKIKGKKKSKKNDKNQERLEEAVYKFKFTKEQNRDMNDKKYLLNSISMTLLARGKIMCHLFPMRKISIFRSPYPTRQGLI